MNTSKLPEWPEKPRASGDYPADEWCGYWIGTTEAALARMEALAEYAMHGMDCNAGDTWPCTCGLSALLSGRGEGNGNG